MLNETIKGGKVDDMILGFGEEWGDILLIETFASNSGTVATASVSSQ